MRFKQKFNYIVPTYKLDARKGVLVENGVKDIDELVQSNRHTAFDKMLDKFLTGDYQFITKPRLDVTEQMLEIAHLIDTAEDYREQYQIGADVSISDIYKFIATEADKLKNVIDKEVNKNGKTEKNEQEVE